MRASARPAARRGLRWPGGAFPWRSWARLRVPAVLASREAGSGHPDLLCRSAERGGAVKVSPSGPRVASREAMALTVDDAWSYSREVRTAAAIDRCSVSDVVHELVATKRALEKLGVRGFAAGEPVQLTRNRHVIVRNPRDPGKRRLLIGSTDGGRVLTLVIEQTTDPTTWLIVTGWSATLAERRILRRGR